jgi:RND family efflux transporter MFP subunit
MKRNTRIIIAVSSLLVVAGAGITFRILNKPVPEYSSLVVEPAIFIQSVEETGVIDTNVSITYGWEKNGRIIEVSKEVGDMVTRNDIIAALDNRTEVNSLRQAQAQLAAAIARLNEAMAMPTLAQQDIYRARIAQAEASLAQANTELNNIRITVAATVADAVRGVQAAETSLQQTDTVSQVVRDAYNNELNTITAAVPNLRDALTASDNILGIDNTFANDSFKDILGVQNISTLTLSNNQYLRAKSAVQVLEGSISQLSSSPTFSDIDRVRGVMTSAVEDVRVLLQFVRTVLDNTPPIGGLTQTTLVGLQSSITAQANSISAARTSLIAAEQAVTAAKNSSVSKEITVANAKAALETANRVGDQQIASAERVVELRQAALQEAKASFTAFISGPREVDLAALRADISRVTAVVAAAQSAVDDMVLRALTDGTITMLQVSVGETVSPNQNIVTIQSNDRKIEVDISESDIAKVSIDDIAQVELDAYPGVVLNGRVVQIHPAATQISGIVYYKTTLEVDVPDDLDVRPGMTADVKIITEQKDSAIALPRRAVLTRGDGSRYVRILTDGARARYREQTVTVGLSGDNGLVEIVSGLSGGEEVITFIKE